MVGHGGSCLIDHLRKGEFNVESEILNMKALHKLSYIGYSLFYVDTMFCFCIVFNTAVGYPICTIHIRTDIMGYLAFMMTKLLHKISQDNI